MPGTEAKRTLAEDVFYPPHESRKASAEYNRLHHELVVVRDEPCWICGTRHSTGGKMETHHAHVEWAAANGVDISKIMADFPSCTDEAALRTWLDSEGNMLVLCDVHHRGALTGIHSVTYPVWQLQRYQGPTWTFVKEA